MTTNQNNMKEVYYTRSRDEYIVQYSYEHKDIFKTLAKVKKEEVAKLLVEAYKIEFNIK